MVDQTNLLELMEMYLTECELRKLAPRTIEGYRKILRPMLLWLGDNEQVDAVGDLVPQHYNGCDIYTLSRLLGHESVSITQRYLEGIQDEQVLSVGLKHSPLMNLDD